jgi:hypothetical protein
MKHIIKIIIITNIYRICLWKKVKLRSRCMVYGKNKLEGGNIINRINSQIGYGTHIGRNSEISNVKIGK